ncbi:unnamed protein product [Linum tenue]|uniref:J domain-containing protein n=1 Tax=Linum tenue TaxID=586396 RepID=A0AAV0KW43_9ROSI|nr:unnamed protein product [Linum tenue]
MSNGILSPVTQLTAGGYSATAARASHFHPASDPHSIGFASSIARFVDLRARRPSRSFRPSNIPIKAAASTATAGSSLYVSTESFYDLLGIPASGTLPEIKHAYRQLARKYHPDVSPQERAEEYTNRFLEVQEAYETLSDPDSRAQYDRALASGFHTAFSATKQFHKGADPKGEWKQRWETQMEELQSIRQGKQSKASWGQRMRRQRSCEVSFS